VVTAGLLEITFRHWAIHPVCLWSTDLNSQPYGFESCGPIFVGHRPMPSRDMRWTKVIHCILRQSRFTYVEDKGKWETM
jgi:hypothetical protein